MAGRRRHRERGESVPPTTTPPWSRRSGRGDVPVAGQLLHGMCDAGARSMRTRALVVMVALALACDSSSGGSGSGDGGSAFDGSSQTADAHAVSVDAPARADADGGITCNGQLCGPGQVCCLGCNGTGGGCGNACPGFACTVLDAAADTSPRACTDKGPDCGMGMVCDLDQARRCTASTAGGTCIVKPTGCATVYLPVCACDGHTYGNDCSRQMAGAQLDHAGACEGADGGTGGVRCGATTCAANEYCVQDCGCGGALICQPPLPGTTCAVPCPIPGGGTGCQPVCTTPPPRCTTSLASCAGALGSDPPRDRIVHCACPP
jgi:hypothetical protein